MYMKHETINKKSWLEKFYVIRLIMSALNWSHIKH